MSSRQEDYIGTLDTRCVFPFAEETCQMDDFSGPG